MKLATLANGTPDGRLHIVSRDHSRCAPAQAAQTLQQALEDWQGTAPALTAEYAALNAGGGQPFDPATALAPLPRAHHDPPSIFPGRERYPRPRAIRLISKTSTTTVRRFKARHWASPGPMARCPS